MTNTDTQTIACPPSCTRQAGHITVDDVDAQAYHCPHGCTVADVVGVAQGVPSSAIVEVDRPDSYHPSTGYVRGETVVICDVGEVLTPTMARELATALLEAAELADSSG